MQRTTANYNEVERINRGRAVGGDAESYELGPNNCAGNLTAHSPSGRVRDAGQSGLTRLPTRVAQAAPSGTGPFNTGPPEPPPVTDTRTAIAWVTALDRGWKAVLLGLLLTAAAQLRHAGLAGALQF